MARQRYYGEKFKPTKGAFGNKSKYQKSLERQAELRKQIAEFEENKKQEEAKTTEEKIAEKKETKTEQTDADNTTE
jgi:hypothetical protein